MKSPVNPCAVTGSCDVVCFFTKTAYSVCFIRSSSPGHCRIPHTRAGSPMDTHSADFLKDQLILFEQSVSETARNLSLPPDPGSWPASAPFAGKCRVRDLLQSSPLSMEEKRVLVLEYDRVVEELDALLEKQGQEYCDLLVAELRDLVHAYHAETCLSSLWCDNECARSGRERRELIGELLGQLSSICPLPALEALVATVDENAVTGGMGDPDGIPAEDPRHGVSPMECGRGKDRYPCAGTIYSARHI